MGYKEGHGLGKDEEGITTPLLVKKTDGRSGVILAGELNTNKPKTSESCVLQMTNIVGPGEVDDLLQEEIEIECKKFGRVLKCIVYEEKRPGTPDNEAVKIFVKFSNHNEAKKGFDVMNGRFFGGRKVMANYFDESRFESNSFQ
eukprot:TRINITY_DN6590_c0_g1_i3.p1 TRINITY_DN6590_c0_g1~~TRINITY_DN6590_c0_g1_i3.p1  ORF type:complete len:165 (-),score=67.48 TRINITY_DN6590_c0_g1_i3:213-644(-)